LNAYFRTENGFDFRVIVVHLKSTKDCEKVRLHETEELNAWVEGYLKVKGNDPDMIIIGDFNFPWGKKTRTTPPQELENMVKGDYLTLVSGEKQVSTNISASYFDQAFVTKSLKPYLVPDSWKANTDRYEQRDIFSDHFPVMFQMKAGTN
jgi:endonuclease/exonuclease/phosphatase family metal-dependent hydrolase